MINDHDLFQQLSGCLFSLPKQKQKQWTGKALGTLLNAWDHNESNNGYMGWHRQAKICSDAVAVVRRHQGLNSKGSGA